MEPTITSEVVVAYSHCPRKAYLLIFSSDKGEPHEYVRILGQQRHENQERYLDLLKQKHADVQPYNVETLRNGSEFLINAQLKADGFEAKCGVLTRIEGKLALGKYSYEPPWIAPSFERTGHRPSQTGRPEAIVPGNPLNPQPHPS